MANYTKVWCLVIDHEKTPIGAPFDISVASGDSIHDLKRKVKNEKPNALVKIDADNLVVWKCPELCDTDEKNEEQILELIKTVNFSDERKIAARKRVMNLGLSENDILLVQMLGTVLLSLHSLLFSNTDGLRYAPKMIFSAHVSLIFLFIMPRLTIIKTPSGVPTARPLSRQNEPNTLQVCILQANCVSQKSSE
jgi:hypothetical protein